MRAGYLEDVQIPRGNPYPGGFDAVLGSHGLQAGTEPYVLRFPGGVEVPVTGGRGDLVDGVQVTLATVAQVDTTGTDLVVEAP